MTISPIKQVIILIIIFSLTNSCGNSGWTPENIRETANQCMVRAEKYLGDNEIDPYCKCVTEKLQKAYPKYEVLHDYSVENLEYYQNIIDLQIALCSQEQFVKGVGALDSTKKERLQRDLTQWTPANEKKLNKAIKGILPAKLLKKIVYNDFYSCILQRARHRYPNFDSLTPLLKNKSKFEEAFLNDREACVAASIKN